MDKHYYYLHTNGDLIHKPASVVDSDPEYFDSPFVKKVWTIDTEDRGTLWIVLTEALALGANKERVKELQNKWGDYFYVVLPYLFVRRKIKKQ